MAQFSVDAQRFDPYKNFKFRIKWDGRHVAGLSKASALKRTTEVVQHRDRDDPPSSNPRARSDYEPITLERGMSRDTEFQRWASKAWNFRSGLDADVSLKKLRKDITIEVYDEAGRLALAYKVFGCWVSGYQAVPHLDANANAVAIQTIKLENEGWERDHEVAEPVEPSFTEPSG